MTDHFTGYEVGSPGREDQMVIGVTAEGDEVPIQALRPGRGIERKDPLPGTPEWMSIVQAGVDSAVAAKPPAEDELAIWRRVAEENLPLRFVRRTDGRLSLDVPPGWALGPAPVHAESPEGSAVMALDPRPPSPLTMPVRLTTLLNHALDAADFSVVVSSGVQDTVQHGLAFVVPWDQWAQAVGEAMDAVLARLMPDEDGLVVGEAHDVDALTQALELLAKATGR